MLSSAALCQDDWSASCLAESWTWVNRTLTGWTTWWLAGWLTDWLKCDSLQQIAVGLTFVCFTLTLTHIKSCVFASEDFCQSYTHWRPMKNSFYLGLHLCCFRILDLHNASVAFYHSLLHHFKDPFHSKTCFCPLKCENLTILTCKPTCAKSVMEEVLSHSSTEK